MRLQDPKRRIPIMERIRAAFLSRFEEMLTDLRDRFGDDIYPEASQHAEDGALILDPEDELPRRVDAVTSEGREYEIERGDPVAPEGEEDLADYPFKVKVHPGTWEALPLQVKFQEALSDGQWEDLASLLRAWYLAGFWGGFGGYLHGFEGLSFGGRTLRCVLDLGSAEVEAVHVLLRSIAAFGEQMAPVEKVTLGEAPTSV
jgi:hypothetical protein